MLTSVTVMQEYHGFNVIEENRPWQPRIRRIEMRLQVFCSRWHTLGLSDLNSCLQCVARAKLEALCRLGLPHKDSELQWVIFESGERDLVALSQPHICSRIAHFVLLRASCDVFDCLIVVLEGVNCRELVSMCFGRFLSSECHELKPAVSASRTLI